jgi:hypothetical protein
MNSFPQTVAQILSVPQTDVGDAVIASIVSIDQCVLGSKCITATMFLSLVPMDPSVALEKLISSASDGSFDLAFEADALIAGYDGVLPRIQVIVLIKKTILKINIVM